MIEVILVMAVMGRKRTVGAPERRLPSLATGNNTNMRHENTKRNF
jgi:hypothetical protein